MILEETPEAALLAEPVSARDHIWGAVDAPITLVEYGDYECSHCGAAFPTVKELQRLLGDRLCFVFRNFPLEEVHPHAEHAAEAAEAAGAQGKFWEMHDRLFTHQDALEDSALVAHAAAIGLDAERFSRELASQAYAARVQEDVISGERSGVEGTPTFFVNGRRHDGPNTLGALLLTMSVSTGRRGATITR
jgi:NhaA family Na+:H+ antiporter